MATSKYGVGKYGFRLYSAVPFQNFAGQGSVVVSSAGLLQKTSPLSATGAVVLSATGYLWDAFIENISGSATINTEAESFASVVRSLVPFPAFIEIGAQGNPYLGPFWVDKVCTADEWNEEPAPVYPWVSSDCAGASWDVSATASSPWSSVADNNASWDIVKNG